MKTIITLKSTVLIIIIAVSFLYPCKAEDTKDSGNETWRKGEKNFAALLGMPQIIELLDNGQMGQGVGYEAKPDADSQAVNMTITEIRKACGKPYSSLEDGEFWGRLGYRTKDGKTIDKIIVVYSINYIKKSSSADPNPSLSANEAKPRRQAKVPETQAEIEDLLTKAGIEIPLYGMTDSGRGVNDPSFTFRAIEKECTHKESGIVFHYKIANYSTSSSINYSVEATNSVETVKNFKSLTEGIGKDTAQAFSDVHNETAASEKESMKTVGIVTITIDPKKISLLLLLPR